MFNRLIVQPLISPILVIAIAVVVVALSLWLYRRQLLSVTSAWHVAIPIVRAVGLLAVVATLLRPSVIRPKSIAEFGPLVVVIDSSRSMGMKDNGRSIGQRVELADALGLLPGGVRQDTTAEFRAGVDELSALVESAALARSELEYAKLSARSPDVAQANFDRQMLAIGERASELASRASSRRGDRRFVGLLTEIARISRDPSGNWYRGARDRLTQLAGMVSEQQSGADERLVRDSKGARAASDAVGDMSRLELANQLLTGPAGLLHSLDPQTPVSAFAIGDGVVPIDLRGTPATAPLKPMFDRSNLTNGLAEVRRSLQGQARLAIVMLSDGRQVGAEGDVATALGTAQTPVFTIACAGPIKRDIAIARVSAPSRAIAGESIPVRVELQTIGEKVDSVPVTIELGASKTSQPVPMKDGRGAATLVIDAMGDGIERLIVSTPVLPDENNADNNRVDRPMKVSGRRLKIALVAGAPGKDYYYVKDVLSRLPWVELTDRLVIPSMGLPMTPEVLLEQDVTLLCDISPTALADAQWNALDQSVKERGHAVVLTAGDGFMAERSVDQPVYRAFLPFSTQPPAWRVWPGEEPAFRFDPVAGAQTVPASGDETDTPRLARTWATMPPVFRYLPLIDLKSDARALLAERESGAAVLTESRSGAGKIYFLGVSETWRWATKGVDDFGAFWPRLIRNAVEPPFVATNGSLSLDVEPVAVSAGKTVAIRARRSGSTSTAPLTAELARGNDAISTIQLSPNPSSAGDRFEATIVAPDPGEYVVRLRASAGDESVSIPLTVESTVADELRNINGDMSLLRRIAESSGGEVLRLEQAKLLPAKISAAREKQSQFVEYRLWDSPYLFLFVLGCLGVEWSLRKRIGMT